MIFFSYEKNKKLNTQERYEIIDFAVQVAEDNGFINSFIFSRALYLFAAIILCEDRKEEIAAMVAENVNAAWDALIEDGTIEDLQEQYKQDLDNLAEEGRIWLEEYTTYLHSARGLLNTLQDFSSDIVKQAAETLQKSADNAGVTQILEVADNWGMNNSLPDSIENIAAESLIEQ